MLFLVDRNNLGDQTLREFQNYATPDDGRRFTELYNADKLTGAGMVDSSHVVISTIQRVYAALRGEQVADTDDPNLDSYTPDRPVEVAYNAQMPPEAFDLVIVDEAHRSIYGVWRGVLEYFDAHIVGLTATPVKQTFGFFRQNLVSEYTYPQSVADNVNVDFDVYRIKTQITERGSTIEAGIWVPKLDRRTRRQRYEQLEDDLTYSPTQLDRAVTSIEQIRLVLETFRDRLFTEIFPGRSSVPKTLIFCKDDNHAEEVVRLARQVFGKGNDFAAKITYTSTRDPKQLLQEFRTSPTLRIAVTVDMIATGTDVKPLECVFFLRDVQSASYFEQMKGRGARTISPTDFQAVTPDAETKTRFVLVDAVGVTEHDYVDAAPLERAKSVSLKKLLDKAAALTLTEDEAATLASRLAKLELQLTPAEREELDGIAGEPLKDVVRRLVAAVDPDEQARAVEAAPGEEPEAVRQRLVDDAVRPVAANPTLRQRILDLRATHDQVIDEVSVDVLLDAHGVVDTEPRPVGGGVVADVPRRAPRRDHRAARPVRAAAAEPHLVRRAARAGRADQAAAVQLDARPDLERLRGDRGRPRPPRRPAHRHRPRLARALHARRGRRAGAVRRQGARAVPGVAGPAGAGRRASSPSGSAGGSTRSPKSSRRPPVSRRTTWTTRRSPSAAASTAPSATLGGGGAVPGTAQPGADSVTAASRWATGPPSGGVCRVVAG